MCYQETGVGFASVQADASLPTAMRHPIEPLCLQLMVRMDTILIGSLASTEVTNL